MINKDGGPELPYNYSHGISLRDYFAAAALPGICAEYLRRAEESGLSYAGALGGAGHDSYIVADAMLAVREKK